MNMNEVFHTNLQYHSIILVCCCLCYNICSVFGWFQTEFSGREGEIYPFQIGYSKGTPVTSLLLDIVMDENFGTASKSSLAECNLKCPSCDLC